MSACASYSVCANNNNNDGEILISSLEYRLKKQTTGDERVIINVNTMYSYGEYVSFKIMTNLSGSTESISIILNRKARLMRQDYYSVNQIF